MTLGRQKAALTVSTTLNWAVLPTTSKGRGYTRWCCASKTRFGSKPVVLRPLCCDAAQSQVSVMLHQCDEPRHAMSLADYRRDMLELDIVSAIGI